MNTTVMTRPRVELTGPHATVAEALRELLATPTVSSRVTGWAATPHPEGAESTATVELYGTRWSVDEAIEALDGYTDLSYSATWAPTPADPTDAADAPTVVYQTLNLKRLLDHARQDAGTIGDLAQAVNELRARADAADHERALLDERICNLGRAVEARHGRAA